MKKTLIIVLAAIAIIVGAGIAVLRYWMAQPLYTPGMVSQQAQTLFAEPLRAADDNFWIAPDQIRLHHFAAGAGRNVLVLHGGPGAPYVEPLPALETLTDRYRFHYYDQRGSGKSTRPIDRFESKNFYENAQRLESTLGLTAQIADVERIRRHLQEEKLILIGHSFGAFLATLYAAEFPEHVAALILISPANVLVMPQEEDLFATVKTLLPESKVSDYEKFLEEYFDFGSLFEKSEQELVALNYEFVPYYQSALAAKGFALPQSDNNGAEYLGGWMVQAMYLGMGQQHDYRQALQAIAAPALVIHGEQDLQTEAASRVYVDALQNAELTVIKNASHFAFIEQPQAFSEKVASFLEQNLQ